MSVLTRRKKVTSEDLNLQQHSFENLKHHHVISPLNAELIPICHMLALVGSQHILQVSRVRVNNTV